MLVGKYDLAQAGAAVTEWPHACGQTVQFGTTSTHISGRKYARQSTSMCSITWSMPIKNTFKTCECE